MRNKITLILLFLFAFTALTSAHPLNNFSVNNFSRLEIEKNQIRLRCVLDMAEIPTFQESQQIDKDKNGVLSDIELALYLEKITAQYAANLTLLVDKQPVEIQPVAKNISLPMGTGNLPTLRIEWDFKAETSSGASDSIHHLQFENNNYKERVGWNEIVINRTADINVFDSSAFGSAATDELKSYPADMLSAPLSEKQIELSFTTSAIPVNAKPLENRNGSVSAPVEKDRFAELISVPEITPTIILLGLFAAFGLGAAHALSPGHGKTVVGAYLVGTRGTFKHALFLGATVTITHTLSVFALGFVALFASEYILPERFFPVLSFLSGLMVFIIGLTLFKNRLFSALGYKSGDIHEHDLSEGEVIDFETDELNLQNSEKVLTHTHGGSTHSHLPPKKIGWGSLLGLGISGGLLPCPSALVLMLAAISKERIGYGLVLTLVFSFGLAATLTGVGLIFLYAGKFFENPSISGNRLVKALPVFSAFVITCVGAVICYSSLTN